MNTTQPKKISRPAKFYIGITAFYFVFYWFDIRWWTLLLAPITAFIAMALVLFGPRLHQIVYRDWFYEIQLKEDDE